MRPIAQVLVAALLLLSACGEPDETSAEDARCLDPQIGTEALDDESTPDPTRASTDPAVIAGFCDGSDDIRLVVMERLGPGAISDLYYLDVYHGAYLVIDGKCHFYTFDHEHARLAHGVVSAEMLAQLTADLRLDRLPSLPSSKDTRTDHYSDTLIATANHSLRCRSEQCRDPEATAALVQARSWLQRLAGQGRPSNGEMTAFAFPTMKSTDPEWERKNPVMQWPLEPTLRSIRDLIASRSAVQPSGLRLYGGAATKALRELRARAIVAHDPPREGLLSFRVSDCGQLYRLVLRDELSELHGKMLRFLDDAWARPMIADCITGSSFTPVSPCPDDEDE